MGTHHDKVSGSAQAREFWDHHHGIAEDPFFWMALPLCRSAINRRISGDPNLWPLEEFARSVGHRQFRSGLSLGCGTGALERAVRRMALCEHVTGLDFSPESISVARSRAQEEGITGIEYRLADLNHLRLPMAAYDVVFIHQSLHHVASIEKLLARVARTLTTDGFLFLDEWTGPSNTEWTTGELADAAKLYEEMPREWRRYDSLPAPILVDDPSEAVRSSSILPTVRLFFEATERPYGGHLVPVLLCQTHRTAEHDPRFGPFLERCLALEDQDLAGANPRSYYTALAGQPYRGLRGILAQIRAMTRRARLFFKYRWLATWHWVLAAVRRKGSSNTI